MEKSKKSTNLILLTVWIIVFCIVNYICLSTLHAITSGDFEYFSRQSRLQNNHKNRWMNQGKGTRYSTSIDDIHGVYVNASKLTSNQLVNQFLNSISGTNINAIVLDIKTERGTINFRIQNKTANQIGAVTNTIPNIENLIALLHEKNYYVIGRIVTFMDPMLAKSDKSLAVVTRNGEIFKDKAGYYWVNPYQKGAWNYNIGIAKECATLGFDEIQFDYVRFSTEADRLCDYKGAKGILKKDIITQFIKCASDNLHKQQVNVSADVFGAIIGSEIDSSIVGQDYKEMSKYLDYICPMIYPSHYGNGYYGLAVPDLQPYELIMNALEDSNQLLARDNNTQTMAKVRPWLQDFTAKWKKQHQVYGTRQVRDQINAVYDSGHQEWLLWNSSSRYTTRALK